MTKMDLQRRFPNGAGDQFGIAGYCVICGCNLMCAPLQYVLDEIPLSNGAWEFCFSVCRGCGRKNPPINIDTFTEESWHNDTWRRK